jgi:hypothetical protein
VSNIADSIDPWAVVFECSAGHRFSIEAQTASRDSSKAADASFPELEGGSPKSVAYFWLTDPRARSILNAQLAQLLRAVVDDRVANARLEVTRCPICSGQLDDVADAPTHRVACPDRHEWRRHSSEISRDGHGEAEPYALWAEHDRTAIGRLIARWLQRDPALTSNLHESVERSLRDCRFADPDAG